MNQPNQSTPVSQQQIQEPSPQKAPMRTPGVPPSDELKKQSGPFLKYLFISLCALLLVAAGAGVTYWYMGREGIFDTEETGLEGEESLEDEESTSDENEETEETEDEPLGSEEKEEAVDPYEGWETYTSSEYHFSFKYESEGEINVNNYPDLPLVLAVDFSEYDTALDWFVTLDESVEEGVASGTPSYSEREDNMKIGDVTGTWLEFPSEEHFVAYSPGWLEFYYIDSYSNVHRLRLTPNPPYQDEVNDTHRDLFELIIGSIEEL